MLGEGGSKASITFTAELARVYYLNVSTSGLQIHVGEFADNGQDAHIMMAILILC